VYAAVKATDEYKELEESCSSFVAEVVNKVATSKLADSDVKPWWFLKWNWRRSFLSKKLADSSPSFDAATKHRRQNKTTVSTYDTSEN
jgi:hypothetical protein